MVRTLILTKIVELIIIMNPIYYICFVLPFNADIAKIKYFIGSIAEDIKSLSATDHVTFSCKRNPNTSSLLFNKYGFVQSNKVFMSQKCGRSNCSSCKLNFLQISQLKYYRIFTLKPCTKANCKTENIIYAAICKLCFYFYFGKTMIEAGPAIPGGQGCEECRH